MDHTQLSSCMLEGLHWFSLKMLDYYVTGQISTGEFLRWFHMPNSSYIEIGQCIVSQYVPAYKPGIDSPAVLNHFIG